jgi:glycosyltransferase involved in cell wall biosynthesis
VDFERFKLNNDGLDIRKLYGIEKEDFVIIFVGRLYNFSGLKEVALELVKTKNKKTKLLIVGDGELYSELKHIKEEYKLEQLILTGQQPYAKIPAFIAASDVCILPSYNNRITRYIVPIKLYEYMAMGKPVIATELPGVVKEFGHDNGMIYVKSPENVISKALELSEAEILLYLGENARGFVEKYSWDDITDIFEEILKDNIIK